MSGSSAVRSVPPVDTLKDQDHLQAELADQVAVLSLNLVEQIDRTLTELGKSPLKERLSGFRACAELLEAALGRRSYMNGSGLPGGLPASVSGDVVGPEAP